MPVFEYVLNAARTLTPTDRLRLVDALWDEVAPSEWPLPSAEWIAEAQRRSECYDKGETSAKPRAEVRASARQKAGLDE